MSNKEQNDARKEVSSSECCCCCSSTVLALSVSVLDIRSVTDESESH